MEKKFYYALPAGRLDFATMNVWEHEIPAYRNAPHVWNVGGQDNVCAFLLETGEGLILIDTGLNLQSFYLTVDRIWSTGHDPKEIKEIFLTHWHGDHTANVRRLKEMTGARIWLSREDEVEHLKHPDGHHNLVVLPYEVDCFYDNSKPFVMGRFSITTRLCPGHTPGSTSFFFEDTDDETGVTYKVALHGGVGVGDMFMARESLIENSHPLDMPKTFVKDCIEMAEMPIDICLCSHLNQGNILPNIPEDPKDYSVFVADYLWKDMLLNRAEAAKKYCID